MISSRSFSSHGSCAELPVYSHHLALMPRPFSVSFPVFLLVHSFGAFDVEADEVWLWHLEVVIWGE